MQEYSCPAPRSGCGASSEFGSLFGSANQDDTMTRNKKYRHCKSKRVRYRKLINRLVETKTADPKAYVEL